MNLLADVRTDRGNRRPSNQDAACLVVPSDAVTLARKGALVVVADGMGGHAAGEAASQLAVSTVERAYYAAAETPAQALRLAVEAANREIYAMAAGTPALAGMGTTCTALAICGGHAVSAHVGDSRIYLIRGGAIFRMTEDDSSVQQMRRRGLLTDEQAHRHADRNVLLRAVGTHPTVTVGGWATPFPVCDADRWLICSDGLHGLLCDEEIQRLAVSFEPGDACDRLVGLAKERGGDDNITVALLAVEARPEALAVPTTRVWRVEQ